VARIIAEAHLHGPNDPPFAFEALTEEVADEYYKMARAAIESLREPTEAMVEAGEKYIRVGRIAEEKYKAMIDAALKEQEGRPVSLNDALFGDVSQETIEIMDRHFSARSTNEGEKGHGR
jgi:hypothetical protein